MLALATVKAILIADTTLMATCTGGVWTHEDTGTRTGLSRTTTPGAFDANGIMRPSIWLKLRDAVPDYVLADDPAQLVSLSQMLEVWYYQDAGYAAIDTMRVRVYRALQGKQLTGTIVVRWAGDVRNERDIELDANVERSDFQTRAVRAVAPAPP